MRIFNYYPDNSPVHDQELEKKIFRHSLLFSAFWILLFWIVILIETIFRTDLHQWGIYPLQIKGLPGILTSPFIHSGYGHLVSNSVPFFILLLALIYFYRNISYRIFFLIYFLSGLSVWLGGRPAWHIGASGVVYGMAAFHFVSGIIRNDIRLLTISVIVVFLYGGMIWGIFPIKPGISWESHLWGGISGVLLAFYYRNYTLRRQKFDWEEEHDIETETGTGEIPSCSPGDIAGEFPEDAPAKNIPNDPDVFKKNNTDGLIR